MKNLRLLIICVLLGLSPICLAKRENYRLKLIGATELQEKGNLAESEQQIKQLLDEYKDTLKKNEIQELEFEIERCKRIRGDYSLTEAELVEMLKSSIRDFSMEEFKKWDEEGRFDVLNIDGEKRYLGASRSNLFFRYPDVRARKIKKGTPDFERFLLDHCREIKEQYRYSSQSTLDPNHFRLRMTITVKPDEVKKGELIRCWMPYPQQFEAQSGVRLLDSSPEIKWMNAPRYPMRSLYFEQPSLGDQPTVFQAEYELTTYPRYNPIDPEKIQIFTRRHPVWLPYTLQTDDHVQLTPDITQLGREICAGERNPYQKARAIYNWISTNIQYSYAREYSTLRNISIYTYHHKYGDCGQQALLFIALCRSQGVPARWQSGWVIYPNFKNLHDWTEIYLEPYGWIPVDVNFAQMIEQDFEFLSPREKQELKDFYFGGLDAYRLIVNSDHGYPHFPKKEHFRSDTVDFQRGEVETKSENIYFGRFGYKLEVDYLDEAQAEPQEDKDQLGPTSPGRAR